MDPDTVDVDNCWLSLHGSEEIIVIGEVFNLFVFCFRKDRDWKHLTKVMIASAVIMKARMMISTGWRSLRSIVVIGLHGGGWEGKEEGVPSPLKRK